MKLYLFDGSCAALTSRLELEYKRLPYEPVYLPPVLHGFVLARNGFPKQSVPALELDGRKISGTREISRVLDELQPDPPLSPPERRAEVEEAERWGEELQDAARRILYCASRRRPSVWRKLVSPGQRPAAKAFLLVASPLLVRGAAYYHGGRDDLCTRDLADLPEWLDRIDTWIGDGLLDARRPNAADFQIAASVRLATLFDDLRDAIVERPVGRLALRLAPDYPGRFASVFPAAWLSAQERSSPR
jgi:glutathione S-transferase